MAAPPLEAPRLQDLPPLPRIPAVARIRGRLGVRMPTWLGDVVMAAPTTRAIREGNPEAEIVALCRPGLLDLARMLPGVDAAVDIGRERGVGGILEARRAYEAQALDAVVVMPRGTRAMLAPRLARIPVRLGYGRGMQRRLLTHAVEDWRPWRRVHRTLWLGLLARAFGVEPLPDVGLRVPASAEAEAERLLRALGRRADVPLVVLEPGAAYGAAKCWPLDRFASLAARLRKDGLDVAVVGAPVSRPLERAIADAAGPGLLRLVGRTPSLAVLAAVLRRASLVVANDTGPMHLAAGVGAPVLALFGATDPAVSGPVGPNRRRLLWRPAPCSPCFLRTCVVDGHPCLQAIGVETVLREVQEMLR